MKLFIVLAAVSLAHAAKLDRTYLPPNAQASAGSAFLQSPLQSNGFQEQTGAYSNGYSNPNAYAQNGAYSGFESRPERAQAAAERNAGILRQDNSNDGETYAYAYETENGIYAEENGVVTNGVQAQGGYTYTGDDGQVYSVRYTADENGFQPQGDHLPTPPPIPEEILKSLEQNARAVAAGSYDNGSYQEAKYDSTQQQYYNNIAHSNSYNNADSVATNNALFRNNAALSGSSIVGVQKAYLPPFAQSNNQRSEVRQLTHIGSAQGSSSIAGVQKSYLPPFAQSNNQRNEARQLTRQSAAQSGRSANTIQKAYLPPFAKNNNQRSEVRQLTRNDAGQIGSSIVGVQKAYLPPFAQRNNNNQRSGVRPLARNSAAQIGNSIAGVPNAYLPPIAQRNNQQSGARQTTFNARDGYRY